MAEVHLARPLDGGGLQVIKRLHPHLAEESHFLRMFLDEARVCARLAHPNVIQILNLGQQAGTFFIAMEYVEGLDLRRVREWCRRNGQGLPADVACQLTVQAAAGLHHAHTRLDGNGKSLGIVHRDVSPHNLLVGFDGVLKVLDFGIARAADQSTHTGVGVLKGKYPYMSPEQARGEKVDPRTDVFALGIVLHEMLTGRVLFKRDTDVSTLRAVTECEVSAPSEVASDLPADLDAIVLKALEKRRARRFQTALELQQAVERFVRARRLQSGPEVVASLMAEVRAAEEASEEKSKPARRERPATPPARTPSKATSVARVREAARPATAVVTKAAHKPPPHRLPRRALWLALPGLALGALLAVVAVTQPTKPGAEVRLRTSPEGAAVFIDGEDLALRTPCTLVGRAAGTYELTFSLPGYQEYRTTIRIPAEGQIQFPMIPLQPGGAWTP
jgi:eukaryotic-like serine/threonine-protein kinase